MVTQVNDMMIIKIGTYVLKLCFGWFGAMALFQNVLNQEIFDMLKNAMPSQVAMVLGFFYVLALVVKKMSDAWAHHQINKFRVKEEEQRHKQSEIYTDIKREELNKHKIK